MPPMAFLRVNLDKAALVMANTLGREVGGAATHGSFLLRLSPKEMWAVSPEL